MAMQMTEMALMGHIIASLVVGVLVEGGVLAGDPLAEAGVGCDVAVDPIILGGGVIDGAAVIGALDGADVGTPPAATGATVAGTILGAPMVSIAVGFMVVCSVPFPQQTPENMDWYSAQVKLGLTEFIYNSRYPHAVSLKSELVSMNTRAGSGRRVEPPQIRQAPAEALVLLHPQSTPAVACKPVHSSVEKVANSCAAAQVTSIIGRVGSGIIEPSSHSGQLSVIPGQPQTDCSGLRTMGLAGQVDSLKYPR